MSQNIHESERNYKDIIELPHHVSSRRQQMPLEDRAAQFSPFAAVVGHEDSVREAARLTDERRELDESEKAVVNEQLNEIQVQLQDQINKELKVQIEHFKADMLKSGGQYVISRGLVKKIDIHARCIQMADESVIKIDDVIGVWIV